MRTSAAGSPIKSAEVLKTANYYVQKLFSTTVGKNILPLDLQLPDGVFASATSDDGYICLKVVNTTSKPCTIDLTLANFTAATVKHTVLRSDCLKAVNKLAFRGKPVEEALPAVTESQGEQRGCITVDSRSVHVYQFYR